MFWVHTHKIRLLLAVAAAVAIAGCSQAPTDDTGDGNDPIVIYDQVITIHSPLANGLYGVATPPLTYTVTEQPEEGGDVADIPNDRLSAVVYDIIDSQAQNPTSLPELFSGITLPEVTDGLHKLEFNVNNEVRENNGDITVVVFYSTDTAVPAIQVNFPADEWDSDSNTWTTNDPTPILDYVIIDDACQEPNSCTAQVLVDGEPVELRDSTTDPSCTGWCLPPFDHDGDYVITISYTDNAGHEGTVVFTIRIDATPPDVVVKEDSPPDPGTTPTPPPTVSVVETTEGFTFTSDTDGTAVVVLDGAQQIATFDAVVAGQTYTVDLTSVPDGQHAFDVLVTDATAQTGGATVVYNLDSTAPTLLVREALIQPNVSINVDNGVLIFSATEDGSAVVTLDAGTAQQTDLATITDLAADVQYPLTLTGLALGEHTVTFTLADMLGNEATEGFAFSVVDSTVPSVNLVDPKNKLYATRDIPLSGSFSDDFTAPENMQVEIIVSRWDTTNGAWIVVDTWATDAICCTATVDQDGEYTLTVTVTDESANVNQANSQFRVDTTPPEVVVNAPADGTVTADNTPLLDVYANEQSDYDVTIYLFQGDYRAHGPEDIPSTFEIDGEMRQADGSPLTDGVWTVVVEMVDEAGNGPYSQDYATGPGRGSSTFTVEAVPPALDILDPRPGQVLTDPNGQLKFKYRVNDAKRVEIYLAEAGQPTPSAPILTEDISPIDATYTRNVAMPPTGNYRAVFRALDPDRADNGVWEGTVEFTVDTSAVEITFPNEDENHFRPEDTIPLTFNYNQADTIEVRLDGVLMTGVDPAQQPINLGPDLAIGSHTVEVKGTNETRVSTDTIEFFIDDSPVSIEIKAPVADHTYQRDWVTLHYHLDGADWVATEEVWLDGVKLEGLTGNGTHRHYNSGGDDHEDGSGQGHGYWRWHHHRNHVVRIHDLAVGDHSITVKALDVDGNELGAESAAFTVETWHHGDRHGNNNRWGKSSCYYDGAGGNPLDLKKCKSSDD